MMSNKWQWRLIAEYAQVYIRHEKLADYLDKNDNLEDVCVVADTFTALTDYRLGLKNQLERVYTQKGVWIIKGWIDQDVSFEEMLEDLHVLEKENK